MVLLMSPANHTTRVLPTPESEALGRKLKAIRESVGLSQVELADRLGINYRTVSHVERGRVHWRESNTAKWARAYGLSRAELENRLGFGLQVQHNDDAFAIEAAAKLGPDQGEILVDVIEELGNWPDRERREILDLFHVQTFNWPRRPARSAEHDADDESPTEE